MQCPKCNVGEMYQFKEDAERAVSFSVFALLIIGVGAAMHLAGVKIWPWWLYAIGGFVLSQALLKWLGSVNRYCPKCHHAVSVWPWTKEEKSVMSDE